MSERDSPWYRLRWHFTGAARSDDWWYKDFETVGAMYTYIKLCDMREMLRTRYLDVLEVSIDGGPFTPLTKIERGCLWVGPAVKAIVATGKGTTT